MQKLIETLRENIGLEEILYCCGIALLYAGLAAQFGHGIAQASTGAVLIGTALLLTFKGS